MKVRAAKSDAPHDNQYMNARSCEDGTAVFSPAATEDMRKVILNSPKTKKSYSNCSKGIEVHVTYKWYVIPIVTKVVEMAGHWEYRVTFICSPNRRNGGSWGIARYFFLLTNSSRWLVIGKSTLLRFACQIIEMAGHGE